jgi:hypothetical protein
MLQAPELAGTATASSLSRRRFLAWTVAGAVGLVTIANEVGDLMSDAPLVRRVRFGAYAANEPWPDLSSHYRLEEALNVPLPVMSWFLGMDSGWPAKQALTAASSGHDLLICLQPSMFNRVAVPFVDILAGKWNRRLDAFFAAAAAYPHRVSIRFAHEMNLSQLPQSIANPMPCTASLDVWLDTWRYIVDRQRAIGGSVEWQWCVNSLDMGAVTAEAYWPGADYVDVLGYDAYNGYGAWTPPLKLLQPMYNRLAALHPTAPIWVSEIGCRAVSAGERYSKARWMEDLLAITDLPRLATVVFFNSNKERDWRVDTQDVRELVGSALQDASIVR